MKSVLRDLDLSPSFAYTNKPALKLNYILFCSSIKPNCSLHIGLSIQRHIASMAHIPESRQVSPANVCAISNQHDSKTWTFGAMTK